MQGQCCIVVSSDTVINVDIKRIEYLYYSIHKNLEFNLTLRVIFMFSRLCYTTGYKQYFIFPWLLYKLSTYKLIQRSI